ETREGILKHCSLENARKLGEIGQRFIDKHQPSLEAQLTNLADEIAYNNHDVDDGLRAGLLTVEQLRELDLFSRPYGYVNQQYPKLDARRTIHEVVRRMINHLVVDLVETSRSRLENAAPGNIEAVRTFPGTLITFSEATRAANEQLKSFLRNALYRHFRVHRMSVKARRVIRELFEIFMHDPRLLPMDYLQKIELRERETGETGGARAISDYIAGMTDRYALTEYDRIFNPHGAN
ncbi:MAG TPA: deoxyguanosinetriphosphate triphosphohydrolase, partial [Gammaproteobacteria bacterium]|nr:deoxyguanosinetriphosphate triphosphohydrolase [Gammaproteobacteria bacterium]